MKRQLARHPLPGAAEPLCNPKQKGGPLPDRPLDEPRGARYSATTHTLTVAVTPAASLTTTS